MKLNKILIPTDFSENSLKAIEYARKVVDPDFGSIDLMYVISCHKFFTDRNERVNLPLFKGAEVYPQQMETIYDNLVSLAEKLLDEDQIGKMHVWVGRTIHDSICSQAASGNYDMVVMSNKGSHDTKLLRGLISEKVIRHATVPVMTLHQDFEEDDVNNIVVPLDLSQLSYQALPMAFNLATSTNAEIEIFHTVEIFNTDLKLLPYNDPFTFNSMLQNEITNKIGEYFERNDQHNISLIKSEDTNEHVLVKINPDSSQVVKLRLIINQGASAYHEIKNFANKNADLVVMTTIGNCDFACPFMGSTAEEVLQHLVVPTVTVWPSESIKYELENNWNSETAYTNSYKRSNDSSLSYAV